MNAAKEFLLQVAKIDCDIYRIRRDIEDARCRLGLRGLSYERDRVQVSADDMMAEAFAQIDTLERQRNKRIADLTRKRGYITQMLNRLPEPYAELLYLRYCDIGQDSRLRPEESKLAIVAKKMGYSFEWTRHLHGKALDMFGRMYEREIEQWKSSQ